MSGASRWLLAPEGASSPARRAPLNPITGSPRARRFAVGLMGPDLLLVTAAGPSGHTAGAAGGADRACAGAGSRRRRLRPGARPGTGADDDPRVAERSDHGVEGDRPLDPD